MSFPKDKTKNELDLIKNNFFILVDAFDQINLDYFVDSGTLLGMYRNGDFIKWDYKDATDLHGIGKYGSDSYRIFYKNEIPENVQDKELKRYLNG